MVYVDPTGHNPISWLKNLSDQIKKQSERLTWFAISETIAPLLPYTAEFMKHSLSDKPSDLTYNSESNIAKSIQNTSAYKSAINKIFDQADKEGQDSIYFDKVIRFSASDNTDLFLALNHVTMKGYAHKIDGEWYIAPIIEDKYDFDYHPELVKGLDVESTGWIVNNIASGSMKNGVMNSYGIYVLMPIEKRRR